MEKRGWYHFILLVFGVVFSMDILATSSSPLPPPYSQSTIPDANAITFSEFPINTYITTQYIDRGFVFGGDTPRIVEDGASSNSPVLSGIPIFQGTIECYFIEPQDPNNIQYPLIPVTATAFSIDAGYFNEVGTTLIEWFDAAGNKMGECLNTQTGFQTFIIEAPEIAGFRISKYANDPAGFGIDNILIKEANSLVFAKKDDTAEACRSHGDQIVYTIEYLYPDDPNHTRQPLTELKIVDYLPEGVYYESSDPQGIYDIVNRTVTWDSLTANIDVLGSVTLTVTVNEQAEPSTELINEADLCESDGTVLLTAICKTKVCCWGGDVIYVDNRATGYNNGTSWANAYTDLQAAIACVERGCVKDIWIARGTYYPGDDVTDSFKIPAGVSVYGGFAGTESELNQRDIKANPTILSGYIRTVNGIEERNRTVVTMGDGCLLDGVIVEKGQLYGIYGDNVDFVIQNCHICNNVNYGLWCQNGNAEVAFTSLYNNGADGIYHNGNNFTLLITNCSIEYNKQNGINCRYSIPIIINSVVHHNGSDSNINNLYYGIRLFQPSSRPVLRNNTIVCNTHAGIYYVNNSYGTLPKPQVKNCIVWHNAEAEGFADIQGLNDIVHSCLTDPNDVYAINTQADARGNLRSNPVFAYSNLSLDNFHLAYNSPCKDMGDPNETATTEVDMDKQARIAGTSVEMGADEVDCEEVFNPCDWNADGLVNMAELDLFSHSWLAAGSSDPNSSDPNYISVCDLNSDWIVDVDDLQLFIPEWCWSACWRYDISAMQEQAVAINAISTDGITENRLLSVDSIETIDRGTLSPQKSIRQEALELQEAIQFLERLWLDDPALRETNTTENWNSFMQSLQESLVELKTKTNTNNLSEEVQ